MHLIESREAAVCDQIMHECWGVIYHKAWSFTGQVWEPRSEYFVEVLSDHLGNYRRPFATKDDWRLIN